MPPEVPPPEVPPPPPPPPGAAGPFALSDEAALRALLAAGPAVRAIQAAGEERVRAAVAQAIAPFRLSSGGYRLENRFRYLLARA